MSVQYNLEDRVVLVAGAGGPLGSEVVAAFQDAGATVCAAKRDPAADDVLYDRQGVHFYTGDFTDEGEVQAAIDELASDHGRLDAVFNNLGEHEGGQPIDETSIEEFEFMVSMNLRTVFLVAKHAVPHLRHTNGALVNVSAMHSLKGEPLDGPYRATKAGVRLLTETIAEENEGTVRANAILPGMIEDPAAIAQGVVFLCSDGAEAISGASLPIDRGM